jgi:hypothetical protein
MGREAVVRAFADISAAFAVLASELDTARPGASADADPLQDAANDCLDILAGIPGVEARSAALKAQAAANFAATAHSMASPDAPVMAREASVAAEIGCVLTIGPRAAGMLLSDSHELATRLPLTMSALQSGTISWQHARVMVDETASLEGVSDCLCRRAVVAG